MRKNPSFEVKGVSGEADRERWVWASIFFGQLLVHLSMIWMLMLVDDDVVVRLTISSVTFAISKMVKTFLFLPYPGFGQLPIWNWSICKFSQIHQSLQIWIWHSPPLKKLVKSLTIEKNQQVKSVISKFRKFLIKIWPIKSIIFH